MPSPSLPSSRRWRRDSAVPKPSSAAVSGTWQRRSGRASLGGRAHRSRRDRRCRSRRHRWCAGQRNTIDDPLRPDRPSLQAADFAAWTCAHTHAGVAPQQVPPGFLDRRLLASAARSVSRRGGGRRDADRGRHQQPASDRQLGGDASRRVQRSRTNPLGRTCSRNRRRNSVAGTVISLRRSPSA